MPTNTSTFLTYLYTIMIAFLAVPRKHWFVWCRCLQHHSVGLLLHYFQFVIFLVVIVGEHCWLFFQFPTFGAKRVGMTFDTSKSICSNKQIKHHMFFKSISDGDEDRCMTFNSHLLCSGKIKKQKKESQQSQTFATTTKFQTSLARFTSHQSSNGAATRRFWICKICSCNQCARITQGFYKLFSLPLVYWWNCR